MKRKTLIKMHSYNSEFYKEIDKLESKTEIKNNISNFSNYKTNNKRENFKNFKKKRISKSYLNLENVINRVPKKYNIQIQSVPGYIKGNIKINKDITFKISKIFNDENNILIGLIDGNGINGKEIGEYIKEKFQLKFNEIFINENKTNLKMDKNKVVENLKLIFKEINKILFLETNLNILSSGCTLTVVLILNKLIFTCNIGNSKAIMIKNEKNNLKAIELTKNHDLSNEKELERVLSNGGEIRKEFDNKKIFVKGKYYPSLKITRCFGNSMGRKIGILEVPYISICKMKSDILSIVLASNGLWEKISPYLLVKSFESVSTNVFCSKLLKLSKKEWLKNKEYNEDITLITLEFNFKI